MASIDFRELYSCFPVAVQIQADELGITIPPAPTVTGGMAFGGGPFNNFVLQALTSLVPHLRSDRGSRAALTTVSGLLTKPGLGVWSAEPGPRGPLVGDVAQEASEVTAVLPIDPEPRGVVTIEASTVFAENDELHAVAIARTSENRRCILRLAGSDLIDGLDSVEAIGTTILVP
jgi:acetyl-CoA C-acetyltransferase